MELVLQGFEGVSRDSIISIRAGSVRRQAPLSSIDKPFKFPCTPEDCGSIKVDVFDHVGSARGFISGGQRDYQLRCEPRGSQGAGERAAGGAAQGMQVSFAVRPAGQAAKGESEEERMKRKAEVVSTLDPYLEKHRIRSFLQSILTSIIKDKPDDPYSFIAKQFDTAKATSKLEQSKAESTGPEKAAPLGDAAPCEDLEELRQKMCSTLQGALEGGRLGAATEAVPACAPKADVVAPMEVEEQRASPPAERQSAAAPSKDESLEAIRNEALAALARGAEDGSLEKALAEVRVERAAEAAEEGQGLEQEELRAQARALLLASAEDGSLQRALALRGQPAELDDEACRDEEPEDEQLDQLRLLAQQVFQEGAESGELLAALEGAMAAGPQGEEDDDADGLTALRLMAKQALEEAAESGQLAAALEKARPASEAAGGEDEPEEEEEEDPLRSQVKDVLFSKAANGELAKALERIRSEPQEGAPAEEGPAAEAASSPDVAARATLDTESLRISCKSVLLASAADGSLDALLAELRDPEETASPGPPPPRNTLAVAPVAQPAESSSAPPPAAATAQEPEAATKKEAMRMSMANALMASAKDGSLEGLLAELEGPRQVAPEAPPPPEAPAEAPAERPVEKLRSERLQLTAQELSSLVEENSRLKEEVATMQALLDQARLSNTRISASSSRQQSPTTSPAKG